MHMNIIAVQCLSTSIAYCSSAFLFFLTLIYHPPLFLPFFSLLPFSPLSLLVRFPTPPFFPTFSFPHISSSLISPFFPFDPYIPYGVRQGGVLSPLLFDVYVNELSELLNKSGIRGNLG